MSVERMCCTVTVESGGGGEQHQPPWSPASCSGVAVGCQSGLVLCSGLLFSRFLLDKRSLRLNPSALGSHKFSNKMKVYVDHLDGKLKQSSITPACPTRREPAHLLMMVKCPEFQVALEKLFADSEQWTFTDLDENNNNVYDSGFLSWFAVLQTTGDLQTDPVPWMKSTELSKGRSVLACGSPFGSFCPDLFMSTLSKGIVSNLAGEENALILTDARCLPGTQGGGVFVTVEDSFYLVGLITSPLCWKSNTWIGLTLVCSVHLILKNVLKAASSDQSLGEMLTNRFTARSRVAPRRTPEDEIYPAVVVVKCGQAWGSGVVLSPHLVLTCRHVVGDGQFLTVTLNTGPRAQTVSSTVLYSTKRSSPYDIAVVRLREPLSNVRLPRITTSFLPGEDVLVLGYGAFGNACGPSLTSGILSRVVSLQHKPVMLQTTCAVNCGASGGAVVRAETGELLGIVSSNTRDFTAKLTYPHLNFSVPVSVLEPLLVGFAQSGEPGVFQELDHAADEVRRVWRLQTPQSKL